MASAIQGRIVSPTLAWHLLSIALAMVTLAPHAAASLGSDVSSVQSDRTQMQGVLRVERTDSYEMHEIQTSSGTVVREFVSGGAVFGVAWQGPALPNLRQVLGAHYEEYLQAAKEARSRRRGRGPVLIQLPGLVVESGGHMRSFSGRAYVPTLLPTGVAAEVVR